MVSKKRSKAATKGSISRRLAEVERKHRKHASRLAEMERKHRKHTSRLAEVERKHRRREAAIKALEASVKRRLKQYERDLSAMKAQQERALAREEEKRRKAYSTFH